MRLKVGFSQYSPGPLADKADVILAALTGNPNFPKATVPTVAQVQKAVDDLRADMAATGPGRPAAVSAAFATLAALLQQLGTNLANDPANSDEALDTTGFDRPRPSTRHSAPPPAPTITRLLDGAHSGEVRVVLPAVSEADNFSGEWAEDPVKGPWQAAPEPFPNSLEVLFTGLTRGKEVWVRLRSNGAHGSSEFGTAAGPWLVR